MKTNIKKYLAILLSFASIITVFAACSKVDESSLLYKKDGKIYYRKDMQDDAYELVTDKNGVTVVDENGNLLWKVTDPQGNEATHPVSYPAYLVEGNYMSCQQFTIKLPKGWESSGKVNFRFKDFDTNRSIEYSFLDEKDKNFMTAEENIKKLEDAFKPMVDEGTAVLTKSTTQIAGRDAVKFVIETKNESPSYMETYYIQGKGGVMCFACFRNPTDTGIDFKAILDTIEYRV